MLILMLLSVTSAQAQTCFYTTIKASTPTARFTITDNKVLDNKTHLIWQRYPIGQTGNDCSGGSSGSFNWQQALAQANGEWRLPNIKELISITETACYEPAINVDVFPNTPNTRFWSSSSTRHDHFHDRVKVLSAYGSSGTIAKELGLAVRLVRNAP